MPSDLTDPIADIIRQLIIDKSLGGETPSDPWPVFSGLLPDQPDEAITCYDTHGRFDGRSMRTGEKFEHPGFQVTVRGQVYAATRNKAESIANAFDLNPPGTVVDVSSGRAYTIQNISRTSPVISLGVGEDDRRRYHFTVNAIITLNEGT